MSYNITKINNVGPDNSSNVNINLTGMSDFAGTPQNGQALGFDSGIWKGLNAQPPQSREPIFSWYNSGSTYVNTNGQIGAYANGHNVLWPISSSFIRINNTSYLTYVRDDTDNGNIPAYSNRNGNLFHYFVLNGSTLNEKKIRCEASYHARHVTGSEQVAYQWVVGQGDLSTNYTAIGPKTLQTPNSSSTAFGIYDMGSSDIHLTLKIYILNGGTVTNLDGNYTGTSFMSIEIIN